jgi:hypothetical protein
MQLTTRLTMKKSRNKFDRSVKQWIMSQDTSIIGIRTLTLWILICEREVEEDVTKPVNIW